MGEDHILTTEPIDRLVTLVEEAARATADSPRNFIEPARGTLDRAKARRHHLIFGRRGSGKTSLLRRANADLTLQRIPTAFVDLEAFKGHSFPDVLLSILIETLRAFDSWLDETATTPASKTTFWKRVFGAAPSKPPLDSKAVASVRATLASSIKELESVLHSADGATIRSTARASADRSSGLHADASVKAGSSTVGGAGSVKVSDQSSLRSEVETVEETRRAKIDFLHRHIIDYQRLFGSIVDLSDHDAFIFLDDLYHLSRADQPHVLDYFHRIIKGRSAWLKVGTIRHRTDWYHHGAPPVGIKLGDDCDDIDLDITLEKYELAKKFLLQVLDQLIEEVDLSGHGLILSDGAVERLVLASGGVARDFLTIFRRSVDIARERGVTHRGPRINAEDVNVAAGEHDTSKRDELKRDTLGEREALEAALLAIQQFCIDNKMNCFLVERDKDSPETQLIGELVDLRFLHVVAARITVRRRPGKLYAAYMLDISQYTGERRRRELTMLAFWKRPELDRLRLAKFVLEGDQLAAAVARLPKPSGNAAG